MPTNCLSVLDHFVGLVLNSFHLTHIRPALPFYTPWKHYKIRDFLKIFQGVQKRNIDLKWVIDKNKSKIWLKESLIAFEISFSLIYLSNLIYSWNTSSTFISDARLKLAKNLANTKRLLKLNFHYLKIIHIFIMFSSKKYDIFWKKKQKNNPIDTGSKLNVHKTFSKRPGRLLKVLCTFNLRPVSTGKCVFIHGIIRLIIMKMKMKMKNRSHRYDINRTRSRHRHKYSTTKKCLSMMMPICIKRNVSNIWSSLRLNTEH